MVSYVKLSVAAFIAVIIFTTLVGAASAARLSASHLNYRIVWSAFEFPNSVRCSVTMEGSLHTRTLAKIAGELIGIITAARARRPCTSGTLWAHSGEANEVLGGTVANRLPWHLTYERFIGTLPNITRIGILYDRMLFIDRATIFGVTLLCEYITGPTNGNATGTATRNTTTGVIDNVVVSGRIRSSTGGLCPEGTISSRAEDGLWTVLGSTIRMTFTLI